MKINLTETFIDTLLKAMPKLPEVSLKPDFTNSVMDRIRLDQALAIDSRVTEINDSIFLKFMVASSFVAVAAVVLALGISIATPVTFEEYMVADYMMNVI